jgi:DNA-binding transcriptional MerR regulator
VAIPPLRMSLIVELYGISESTLLSYEAAGLVAPLRTDSERYYSKKDRVRIEVILKARRFGFTAREIRTILKAYIPKYNEPSLCRAETKDRVVQLEKEQQFSGAAIDRPKSNATEDGRCDVLISERLMPRFYFDVHDGKHIIDEDGKECADLDAARRVAVALINEMLGKEMGVWDGKLWTMVVRNEDRHAVATVVFSAS